jgi:hypothetical protein
MKQDVKTTFANKICNIGKLHILEGRLCSSQLSNGISWKKYNICGLYYKHAMIVNDDSSVVIKWSFKLIDDPRVIIYDRHRFIVQDLLLSQDNFFKFQTFEWFILNLSFIFS